LNYTTLRKRLRERPFAVCTADDADSAAALAPAITTVSEAVAYLTVSEADLQALIDEGQVKAKKIGSDFCISKKTLDDFLTS
jgi:excisionase family DNA binding protein